MLKEDLQDSIDDLDVQETKWNLDMIKYIPRLMGNYQRFNDAKEILNSNGKELWQNWRH